VLSSPHALTAPLTAAWPIDEANDACFIVRDNTGQALGYFYFDGERSVAAVANAHQLPISGKCEEYSGACLRRRANAVWYIFTERRWGGRYLEPSINALVEA